MMLPIYITELTTGPLILAALFIWRWAGGRRLVLDKSAG